MTKKYKTIDIIVLWIKDYLKNRNSPILQIGSDTNNLKYIFFDENTIICKKTEFFIKVFKKTNKKKIAKKIILDINKYEQITNHQ